MECNPVKLKRYIRGVSRALPCGRKVKKQIVSQIRSSIADYLQENPNADFEAVQLHFGTPKEIAASYIHEQDAAALLNTVQIKKKILAIVAGTMALVLLMWVGAVAWAIVDREKSMPPTIVVNTKQE